MLRPLSPTDLRDLNAVHGQLQSGDAPGALARFEALPAPSRDHPNGLYLKGFILQALGRLEEARRAMEEGLERAPEFVGLLNSYVMNRAWTFTVTTRANRIEFGRFVLVNLIALLLNLAVLKYLTSLGLIPEIAQILAIGASLLANFAGNKWWTFRSAT